MLPKWDTNYSVHNAKIDAQHKKLFELAAKVEFMSDKSISKSDIKELLVEFFNYMKNHFNDEEEYMQLINYPELEKHKKFHKEIIQMMINLIKDIKSTNDLKEKLYIITKNWLLEHILYEDFEVEKFRRSALSLDNKDDVGFEESAEDNDKLSFYLYICNCKGKYHDVPLNVYEKIELQGVKFTCKACKSAIKFHKKQS